MSIEVASITITVILAFVGYLFTYLNTLRLSQRSERLERVNRQLAEFYGPMFALTQASGNAWHAFRAKYRPHQAYFGESNPPSEDELKAWRLWMSTVFMPINLRLYELILSKSDLLIESQMPQCLLTLVAHVAAYQTVIKGWEENDLSKHTSSINYPFDIDAYAQKSFEALKSQQAALLGRK